jgi:hypothetical protein
VVVAKREAVSDVVVVAPEVAADSLPQWLWIGKTNPLPRHRSRADQALPTPS